MAAIGFSTIFITSFIAILWASSINGDNAESGAYPYLVAIKYTAVNSFRCNGHILSPSWIVSTGLCIHRFEKNELHVQYGVTKLSSFDNTVNIAKLIQHPNYNSFTSENNIGLIKLERDLEYNENTQPIELPPNNGIPSVGTKCKSVGWFGNANKKPVLDLQVFDATIMSDMDCSEIRNEKIKHTQICTRHPFGRDDCTAGIGNGLVFDNYLYGLGVKGTAACQATQDPSVYIKMNSYYSWIVENIVNYEMENILKSAELETSEMLNNFCAKLESQLPQRYQTSYPIINL